MAKTSAPSSHAPDRVGLRVLEDVVAEAHDELVARRELARHADDLRDAAGLGLHLVGEVEVEEHLVALARLDVPVAEQVDELARVLLAGDDQDLAHADALEQLQRVIDHRPAADGQQVLVRHARQLGEPRRVPTGGDQSLHGEPDGTARPRTRNEAEHAGDDADGGDAGPHRLVAVGMPYLEAEERRGRPADRPRPAERAHVGAADVRRRERGDDRLRRRHPEHLADHEEDDHDQDHPGRAVPAEQQERDAHQRHRDAELQRRRDRRRSRGSDAAGRASRTAG